jgi:hypothetical protein
MNEADMPGQQPAQSTPAIPKWGRWGDRVAAKIAEQKAILAARNAKEGRDSTPNQKPDVTE